jgi:hypothetical protein
MPLASNMTTVLALSAHLTILRLFLENGTTPGKAKLAGSPSVVKRVHRSSFGHTTAVFYTVGPPQPFRGGANEQFLR